LDKQFDGQYSLAAEIGAYDNEESLMTQIISKIMDSDLKRFTSILMESHNNIH